MIDLINRIDDPVCRDIMMRHYIGGETWESIAVDKNYSLAHIFRLRIKAFIEILQNGR